MPPAILPIKEVMRAKREGSIQESSSIYSPSSFSSSSIVHHRRLLPSFTPLVERVIYIIYFFFFRISFLVFGCCFPSIAHFSRRVTCSLLLLALLPFSPHSSPRLSILVHQPPCPTVPSIRTFFFIAFFLMAQYCNRLCSR
jgi:hypothetical protein